MGKDKHFLNLVNPTRSETDSKPPAALVSIEILSFGDWICCKAYFFFFSEIMVWVYCSTLSSPFACSFPPWAFCSTHSAAHRTTPKWGSQHNVVSSRCPGKAEEGQTWQPNPKQTQPWSILLPWRWLETAAQYLLLLLSLSTAPSIRSTHFIRHLPQTFKCH